MKHPVRFEEFFDFLIVNQISVSDKQKEDFRDYRGLIKNWSKRQNLVSKSDVPHLIERHFLPSAFVASILPDTIDGKAIDVGTGAGFPGIILKIIRPELSLVLLDSSRKKVIFLQEVCERLKYDCQIICQRSEIYQVDASGKYRVIVSRAVSSLGKLWQWTSGMLEKGGSLYALKGGNCKAEIAEVKDKNVNVRVVSPGKNWIDFSPFLVDKCVVILEKQ